MIEQLLTFFAMFLWLDIQQWDKEYYWSWVEITWYLETWDISWQMNMQDIQKTIIIEDYFLFLDRLWKINYARGCAWEATPPIWNWQRRVKCWIRSFDCWWLMKYYWRIKWIFEKSDMAYLRSDSLYALWHPKDPRTAERWDFMYWKWFGKAEWKTHFAVVSSWYNDETHTMWIYDNANWPNTNKTWEREIRVSCDSRKCWYIGRYRIYVATNWLVELASEKWIQVNAFKILDE